MMRIALLTWWRKALFTYGYFPSSVKGSIKTLLLDANVTAQLDSIVQKGLGYGDDVVRQRMSDLVERLDPNVFIMPGLGVGESVVRRTEVKEASNYSRRSVNALAALADGGRHVKSWLAGEPATVGAERNAWLVGDELLSHIAILRDDFVMPSYAMVLKSYQLYLQGGRAEAAFRSLAAFAEELFGRGSREVILGALLLCGNSRGREMAMNIMKLRKKRDALGRLDDLWGTCFDLTYSRVAVMPSLPELNGAFELPCVFVTEDKHLGHFLDLIRPAGATPLARGGGITADSVRLDGMLAERMFRVVNDVARQGNSRVLNDTTDLELMARIRRFKAKKYVAELEGWIIAHG